MQRAARDHGMSVVLTKTHDYLRPAPEWIDEVIQRGVGAIVLVFADLDGDNKARLRSRNVPFAIVNPAAPAAPDVPTVSSSAQRGGLEATQHLIALGHRRIGIITGPNDLLTAQARAAGYRQALELAGIPVDETLVRPGRFFRVDGENQGRQLLTLSDRPTAIFAGSDPQAFGVYRAARALGLRIPTDLSVVGFDDLETAQSVGPSLTTVRQPLAEMAETAARIALQQRNERSKWQPQPHLELDTSLVVRASTAPPPSEFRPVR
jgi:LacI family xylobiose transport system transcriptional regulator